MAWRTASSSIWTPGRSPVNLDGMRVETGPFDGEFVDGDEFTGRRRGGLREQDTGEQRE